LVGLLKKWFVKKDRKKVKDIENKLKKMRKKVDSVVRVFVLMDLFYLSFFLTLFPPLEIQ